MSGKFYNLVKSYLYRRHQKVILSQNNGIESTREKIKQGVPQGSILGPIFFLIYINDLPNLASIGTKYSDSTRIRINNLRETINVLNREKCSLPKKHRIILIGDSHIKGYACNLKSLLSDNYDFFSLV